MHEKMVQKSCIIYVFFFVTQLFSWILNINYLGNKKKEKRSLFSSIELYIYILLYITYTNI